MPGMKSQGLPASAVKEYLADGAWHTAEEIAANLGDSIPAEIRIRQSLNWRRDSRKKWSSYNNSSLPLHVQLFNGALFSVYQRVGCLVRSGKVEKTTIDGKRHYRLLAASK